MCLEIKKRLSTAKYPQFYWITAFDHVLRYWTAILDHPDFVLLVRAQTKEHPNFDSLPPAMDHALCEYFAHNGQVLPPDLHTIELLKIEYEAWCDRGGISQRVSHQITTHLDGPYLDKLMELTRRPKVICGQADSNLPG